MTLSTLLILAVRRTCTIYDLVYVLANHVSLVAQWLEHPIGVRKVIGSIPVGDSAEFFLCSTLVA